MSTCAECRQNLSSTDIICPNCGNAIVPAFKSQKSAVIALLLCLFFGCLGLHRFYTGKTKSGLIMLITLGALGLWTLIDLITIALSRFKDNTGRTLLFTDIKESPFKTSMLVIGSVVANIAYYVMIFFTIVFILTNGFVSVAQNQLKALREGNIIAAYSFMADQKLTNVDFNAFKAYVQNHPALISNDGAFFTYRKYEDNQAYIRGKLDTLNGNTFILEYMLVKIDSVWKISGLRIRPISKSTSAELMTFTDPDKSYTIQYPGDWTHETTGKATILFSGPAGTPSNATAITIQPISTQGVAPQENPINLVITDLKKQIGDQTANASFSDINDVTLPSNDKIQGKSIIATYSYNGQMMKKMQYVFLDKDKNIIYSWSFTSPQNQYDNDLDTAKKMLDSWEIK